MKKLLRDFSESELISAFGELTTDECNTIRSGEAGELEFDPQMETGIKQGLKELGIEIRSQQSKIPPMPESLKATLMSEIQTGVTARPSGSGAKQEKPRNSRFGLWHIVGLTGAVAAVAVGMYFSGNRNSSTIVKANSATVLTPGKVTGFRDPIFTWKTDNGGVVDLKVIDQQSGKVIASIEKAFSPISFQALTKDGILEAGKNYRVEIVVAEKSLVEASFMIDKQAISSGPEREQTLQGVIDQCRRLIAAGRPADAWMIWAKLTDAEKANPEMQRLKALILKQIG